MARPRVMRMWPLNTEPTGAERKGSSARAAKAVSVSAPASSTAMGVRRQSAPRAKRDGGAPRSRAGGSCSKIVSPSSHSGP